MNNIFVYNVKLGTTWKKILRVVLQNVLLIILKIKLLKDVINAQQDVMYVIQTINVSNVLKTIIVLEINV